MEKNGIKKISTDDLKNSCVLSLLLNKVKPKDKEPISTFHQILNSSMSKIDNCYEESPYFAYLVKCKRQYRKKNLSRIQKSTILHHSMSFKFPLFDNEEKSRRTISKHKELIKNKSLPLIPGITRTNTSKIRELDKDLENALEKINQKENEKIKNYLNEQSMKNEPWFMKVKEGNPLRKLFERDEKIKRNNTNIRKNRNFNNIGNVEFQKREEIFVSEKENVQSFLIALRKEINDNNSSIIMPTKTNKINNKFRKLLNKCNMQIKNGKSIDEIIIKNNNHYNKKLKEMKSLGKKLNENEDKKFIEELKTKNRYEILHEKNLKELKRRVLVKISESLAYKNRKYYLKIVNNDLQSHPYEIYLKELNQINNEKERKKIEEELQMLRIRNILENTQKGRECFRNRVNELTKKNNLLLEEDKKGHYYPIKNEYFKEKENSSDDMNHNISLIKH